MKNYKITVNGTAYDVAVEDLGSSAAPVTAPVVTPKAATPAPVAAPATPKAAGAQGSVVIAAPMPGKILSVKANVGATVKRGEVVLLLEAMKMENEVVAPEDGTIASINVAAGDSVESGETLATLN